MIAPKRRMVEETMVAPVQLLPGETADIRADVQHLLENAEEWLTTPNTRLGGRKPEDLIGTAEEIKVRNILRAAVFSSMA
jgi:uncharacterized protein (DUF2384 family)